MRINPRVLVMREAITKIVPMLTQKKVQVTLRGMRAFVAFDPKTHEPMRVNLPYLPDDSSDTLIDAVQGFLDHEVGHILYSDPAAIARAVAQNETIAFLHNAIEDPTIAEGHMKRDFVGCAYNLANLSNFFLAKVIAPQFEAARASGDQEQITATLVVPAIRAWAGQSEYADFMADKWPLIDGWVKSMGKDLIDAVPRVKNSEDAVSLAEKMFARIGKLPSPPPPEQGESGASGESDEPQAGKSGESQKSEKSEGKGKGNGKPEKKDGEGKSDEGKAGKPKKDGSKDEGDDEGSGAGAGEESGDDPAEGADGEGSAQDKGKQDASEEDERDAEGARSGVVNEFRDKLIAAINEHQDFDTAVAEALSESAQDSANKSDYLVFTRDDDVIEPLEYTPAAVAMVPKMQAQVDHMLGPLTTEIERMISARSAAVWTGGHRTGRLHGAALSRSLFGDVDLFRRKQVNKTKDVAVSLVVDCSGSMCSDGKIETACATAYALASILDRLNIKCEVIGFTTKSLSRQVMEDLRKDPLGKSYCRFEALYMPVFKAFTERVGVDTRARLVQATISRSLCHSNVDGESVQIAYRRLMMRSETRKAMIVLSDGNPAVSGGGNLQGHLKAVVKQIEKSGVDIVGIGICDRSVSKFYSKFAIMHSVRELPQIVTGELKRMLTQ